MAGNLAPSCWRCGHPRGQHPDAGHCVVCQCGGFTLRTGEPLPAMPPWWDGLYDQLLAGRRADCPDGCAAHRRPCHHCQLWADGVEAVLEAIQDVARRGM